MSGLPGFVPLLLVAAIVQAGDVPQAGSAGEIVPVAVTNFPDLVRVEGNVAVQGPLHQTSLATLTDVLVPPVRRDDANHLVDAGTIATDGFAAVVVSLVGEVRGPAQKVAEVGAVLLPDDDRVLRAFTERGEMLLPLIVRCDQAGGASPYFAGASQRFTVAFPRYRVYLYNQGERTVSVTVHAYLTD